MHSEKLKDTALGLMVLAFAIGGFLFVNPTDAPVAEGPGGMSWRTVPLIYSGLLLVLAVLFISITLLRGPIPTEVGAREPVGEAAGPDGEGDGEPAGPEPERFGLRLSTLRRVAVVVVLVIYSQALGAFGFAISTPVFLFVLLHVFGKSNVRENALVALIGGLLLWVLFAHLLHMPLRGDLWDPLSPALTGLMRSLGT